MLERGRLREKREKPRGVWEGVARAGRGPPRWLREPVGFNFEAPAGSVLEPHLKIGHRRGFPMAAGAGVNERSTEVGAV